MNKFFMLLLFSVIIASVSQILLKKSAMKTYTSFIREYINPYVIIGYGMMSLSMILTIAAYSGLDYKNGAIIESLGYVIVMFLSFFLFGERISKKKVIGTILILFGIFVYYI